MMLHWESPHTNGKRSTFQRRVRWNEYQIYQIDSLLQKLYTKFERERIGSGSKVLSF